ncbi:MAG: hypothetical protein DRJ43_00740 [Thermoprotei archaeon]|nr:MAG: hypothetical protein DRJ43_00740 [Thermoprotei archaeon]
MVAMELAKTVIVADALLPVKVLKDVRASLPGRVGDLVLRRGAKLELPLREALPLLRKGLVAVDPSRLYTLQELNKIRWIESRDPQMIQKLDEHFYLKARLTLAHLEKEEGVSGYRLEVAKALIIDIVKLRLQKVVRSVTANPEPNRDFMEKLTWEERALYVKLCDLVNSWYRSMLEFIEEGDVLGGSPA